MTFDDFLRDQASDFPFTFTEAEDLQTPEDIRAIRRLAESLGRPSDDVREGDGSPVRILLGSRASVTRECGEWIWLRTRRNGVRVSRVVSRREAYTLVLKGARS